MRNAVQKICSWFCTPHRRMAGVIATMALIWGAMAVCQGVRGPVNSADWALMSEVGRRVALGDTLYVDAMDQKGPLCYATYALLWKLFHTQMGVFVASNVLIWALLLATSGIAARMVEDARKPWAHILAQALLTGVIFVPHVGCLELWIAPFALLSALWVRRLVSGGEVRDLCWVVVGISAGFALGAKFTCCAQFVFVMCYGAAQRRTHGLQKAVGIALIACALTAFGTLGWMVAAGSFDGMIEHYVHAASDGYAERMNMLTYLAGDNPSTTHTTSFAVGLAVSVWAIAVTARAAKRRMLVVASGVLLAACCFATFVGYYRFQLSVLAVLGACDVRGTAWRLQPARWLDEHVGRFRIVGVACVIGIAASTSYTCGGTSNMVQKAENLRNCLHQTVGDSNSVLVWPFGHTWVYGELGLDFPYPIPARYNASQDLWDATAGADVEAHRWRYVVASVADNSVKPGDRVKLGDEWFTIAGAVSDMAIAIGGASEQDALTCEPYRLP